MTHPTVPTPLFMTPSGHSATKAWQRQPQPPAPLWGGPHTYSMGWSSWLLHSPFTRACFCTSSVTISVTHLVMLFAVLRRCIYKVPYRRWLTIGTSAHAVCMFLGALALVFANPDEQMSEDARKLFSLAPMLPLLLSGAAYQMAFSSTGPLLLLDMCVWRGENQCVAEIVAFCVSHSHKRENCQCFAQGAVETSKLCDCCHEYCPLHHSWRGTTPDLVHKIAWQCCFAACK